MHYPPGGCVFVCWFVRALGWLGWVFSSATFGVRSMPNVVVTSLVLVLARVLGGWLDGLD
jgi:hypothetical protein